MSVDDLIARLRELDRDLHSKLPPDLQPPTGEECSVYGQAATTLHSQALQLERMREILDEARLQIEYLDAKFQPTGTSAATLARINAALGDAALDGAPSAPDQSATIERMRKALEEIDRWSLVIESAVRNDAPSDHKGVLSAIKTVRAALAGAEEK